MNRRIFVLSILVLLGTALFQACNRNISTSPLTAFMPLEVKSRSITRATGGTLVLSDGTGVQVPPDAFNQDTTVGIKKMPVASIPGMGPDLLPLKYAYYFNAGGASFTSDVTLTLAYKITDIPSGHSESDLQVFFYNGSGWVVVPSTLDTTLKQKTVVTDHFSPWVLAVSDGTVTPSGPTYTSTWTPTSTPTPTGTWYSPTPVPSNTPNPNCTPFVFITPTATYSCGPLPAAGNLIEQQYYETEACSNGCYNWAGFNVSPDMTTSSFYRETIYGHITATGNGDISAPMADRHVYYFYTGFVTGNNIVLDCMGGNQYQLIMDPCYGTAVTFAAGPVTYSDSQAVNDMSLEVVGTNGNPGPFRLSVWVNPFVPTVTYTPPTTPTPTNTATLTPAITSTP